MSKKPEFKYLGLLTYCESVWRFDIVNRDRQRAAEHVILTPPGSGLLVMRHHERYRQDVLGTRGSIPIGTIPPGQKVTIVIWSSSFSEHAADGVRIDSSLGQARIKLLFPGKRPRAPIPAAARDQGALLMPPPPR